MDSSSLSRFFSVVDVWRISCSFGHGREPILQRNLQRKYSPDLVHGRQHGKRTGQQRSMGVADRRRKPTAFAGFLAVAGMKMLVVSFS
jgi:hypothetical protein